MSLDFIPWPKIPRLSKTTFITEKIDGTNAAIVIRELHMMDELHPCETGVFTGGELPDYAVRAQSRKRIISPDDDNFGFALWVQQNARALASFLGEGAHFGEWWGVGIQRGYGLRERRFSLFNTHRWKQENLEACGLTEIGVHVVPTLSVWSTIDSNEVDGCLSLLDKYGSRAAPGFWPAEGVVIYHTASNQMFKRMLVDDDVPKGFSQESDSEQSELEEAA